MFDSIPYLVPTQFQETISPPISRLKIPALMIEYKTALRAAFASNIQYEKHED
jgi:hypothetical protein